MVSPKRPSRGFCQHRKSSSLFRLSQKWRQGSSAQILPLDNIECNSPFSFWTRKIRISRDIRLSSVATTTQKMPEIFKRALSSAMSPLDLRIMQNVEAMMVQWLARMSGRRHYLVFAKLPLNTSTPFWMQGIVFDLFFQVMQPWILGSYFFPFSLSLWNCRRIFLMTRFGSLMNFPACC